MKIVNIKVLVYFRPSSTSFENHEYEYCHGITGQTARYYYISSRALFGKGFKKSKKFITTYKSDETPVPQSKIHYHK